MHGTTRLAVNVPTKALDSLQAYATMHEITVTEAIRRALCLQDFLSKEIVKGGKVLIEDEGGKIHRLSAV